MRTSPLRETFFTQFAFHSSAVCFSDDVATAAVIVVMVAKACDVVAACTFPLHYLPLVAVVTINTEFKRLIYFNSYDPRDNCYTYKALISIKHL